MQAEENCEYLKTKRCSENRHLQKSDKMDMLTVESDYIDENFKDTMNIIAKKEGLISYKIDAKNMAPNGNNYLGLITEVNIKGTTQHGNKEINLFVKVVPDAIKSLKVLDVNKLHDIERFVYDDISKSFYELQDEANIPLKYRFNFVKYYEESNSKFLIMENMAKKGFVLWPRRDVISIEWAEKSIEALAKFHALSFVLQEKHPNYMKENIMAIPYAVNVLEGEWAEFYTNMCNSVVDYISEDAQKRIKNYLPGSIEKINKFLKPGPNVTRCLCHGDYKTGNLLMREVDGKKEVLPVDYQLVNYGSPLTDFNFFLFLISDKKFRRNHLDYLKELYYNTMDNFMKYFDLSFEDIFPRQRYEKEFKEGLEYGLLVATWALPFMLADDDDFFDFGTMKLTDGTWHSVKNKRILLRYQEIVDDFIEWGYL